jgi:hypothetical protein
MKVVLRDSTTYEVTRIDVSASHPHDSNITLILKEPINGLKTLGLKDTDIDYIQE